MKLWAWSTGTYGVNRVRVCERRAGGVLFLETYKKHALRGSRPTIVRESLRHRDRDLAKQRAEEIAAQLRKTGERPAGDLTIAQLFDLYLADVTPTKVPMVQAHDRSALQLIVQCLGADRRARTLSNTDIARYTAARARGDLTAIWRGRPRMMRPAGVRTIQRDLLLLRAVCNWAAHQANRAGVPLLERNPIAGLEIPGEENPRRPMIRDDEYRDMLEAAWRLEVDGTIDMAPNEFPRPPIYYVLLLITAHETGHRIGAITRLQWRDIDFGREEITWRKENDKIGMEHTTPLTPAALQAFNRAVRWTPEAAPTDFIFQRLPERGALTARDCKLIWHLLEVESKIERIAGRGWHSLRRKFATELKDEPAKDVAHLGGWKDTATVMKYQAADPRTMRAALERRDTGKTGAKPVDVHPSKSPRKRDRAAEERRRDSRLRAKTPSAAAGATLRPRQSSKPPGKISREFLGRMKRLRKKINANESRAAK